MIDVQNLTKTFATKTVIKNISFAIPKNSITGLLGANGAGKTTTLKILTGTLKPTSGTIKILNKDFLKDSLTIQKQIGYVPENYFLYPQLAVFDFLKFAGQMRRMSKTILQTRLEFVITTCELKNVLSQKIATLSKGFKQRVSLAQALLHDPEILILDEPTEGLDPKQILHIRSLLKTLSQNKTILFSTHILSEVEKLCDTVLILNQGKISFADALKDLGSSSQDLEKKVLELMS